MAVLKKTAIVTDEDKMPFETELCLNKHKKPALSGGFLRNEFISSAARRRLNL